MAWWWSGPQRRRARSLRSFIAVFALTAPMLAACAVPPAETPEERLVRRTVSCQEAGFTQGSPDFRLCLLVQETHDRLAVMERRLSWIEQDVRFPTPYRFGPYW